MLNTEQRIICCLQLIMYYMCTHIIARCLRRWWWWRCPLYNLETGHQGATPLPDVLSIGVVELQRPVVPLHCSPHRDVIDTRDYVSEVV